MQDLRRICTRLLLKEYCVFYLLRIVCWLLTESCNDLLRILQQSCSRSLLGEQILHEICTGSARNFCCMSLSKIWWADLCKICVRSVQDFCLKNLTTHCWQTACYGKNLPQICSISAANICKQIHALQMHESYSRLLTDWQHRPLWTESAANSLSFLLQVNWCKALLGRKCYRGLSKILQEILRKYCRIKQKKLNYIAIMCKHLLLLQWLQYINV